MLQSDRNYPAAKAVPPRKIRVISSDRRRPLIDWGELWAFREVTFLLVWRSFKARYRQTYFGLLWAVAQPLVALGVYSVVFGKLVGVPSQGVPYPLFVLCGLIPWNFITRSVLAMTGSDPVGPGSGQARLLPAPGDPAERACLDVQQYVLRLGSPRRSALAYYGVVPPLQVVLVPVFFALAAAVALGLGLMTAALNVRFRDVGYAMPFAMQTMLFLTPVIYPATLLPDRVAEWCCVQSGGRGHRRVALEHSRDPRGSDGLS